MLDRLPYSAFLVYPPKRQCVSDLDRNAQAFVVDGIKTFRPDSVHKVITALSRPEMRSYFKGFLGPGITLVPAAGRAPLWPGALWSVEEICKLMVQGGLGRTVSRLVLRMRPVAKSAWAAPGGRPTSKEHYDSMVAPRSLLPAGDLTIIDDVVTKGATILAIASRLHEAYPSATIRSFAIARTIPGNITKFDQPCIGEIIRNGDDSYRIP